MEEYYSLREMKTIIDYIVSKEAYAETKGNDIWKKIAESTETKRNWQSLQQTFKNNILPMIDNSYFQLSVNQINSFREGFEFGENVKDNELESDNSNENSVNLKPLPSLIETFGKGFVDATGILPSPIRYIYLNDVSEFPEICKTWKALKKKEFIPMEEPIAEMGYMAEAEPIAEMGYMAAAEPIAEMGYMAEAEPIAEMGYMAEAEPIAEMGYMAAAEPIAEMGYMAEAEPIAEMGYMAAAEPIAEMGYMAEAEPIAEMGYMAAAEPIAEMGYMAEAEPIAEMGYMAEAEPIAEMGYMAEAEPIAEMESMTRAECFINSEPAEPVVETQYITEVEPVVQTIPNSIPIINEDLFKSIKSALSRPLNVEHKSDLLKSILKPLNVELKNKPKNYKKDEKKGQCAIGLTKPIEEAEADLVTKSIEEPEFVLETIPETKPEKDEKKGQYAIGLTKPIQEAEVDLVTESIEEAEFVLETIPETKPVVEAKCITQVESVIQPNFFKSKRRAPPRPLNEELKKKPKKHNKDKKKAQYAIGSAKPIEGAEADLVTESTAEAESVLEMIPEAKPVVEAKCVTEVESVKKPKVFNSKRKAPPRPLNVELKKKPKKHNKDKKKGQYAIGSAKPIEGAEADLVTESTAEAESVLETIPEAKPVVEAKCVTQVESVMKPKVFNSKIRAPPRSHSVELKKKPKKYNKAKKNGQYAVASTKPIEKAEADLVTKSIAEAESILETIPEAKPVVEAKCVTQVESVIQLKFFESKIIAPSRPLNTELEKKPKKYNKDKKKETKKTGIRKSPRIADVKKKLADIHCGC